MNYRNKLFTYALASVISIGLIGSTAVSTFAITVHQDMHIVEDYEKLDADTQQKVDAIEATLKSELAKLGVTPHKHKHKDSMFANLDEESKAKAYEIMHKWKDGTLSHEEAKAQLAKLGVELPQHHEKFENLDEKTKAQIYVIMDQVKKGTMTQEEADKKFNELGVEVPQHHGNKDKFKTLDNETKEQVKELIEETKEELEELGVELSDKHLKHLEKLTK